MCSVLLTPSPLKKKASPVIFLRWFLTGAWEERIGEAVFLVFSIGQLESKGGTKYQTLLWALPRLRGGVALADFHLNLLFFFNLLQSLRPE